MQFPLVWLICVLSAICGLMIAQNARLPFRARFLLCSFLGSLAFLAFLVGARLAGWLSWLDGIQPVVAVILGPLSYLGFRALTRDGLPPKQHLLLIYALPILIVQILFLSPFMVPIDIMIMVINGVYLFKLASLLRLGSDEFSQIPPDSERFVRVSLFGTTILFVLLITSDLVIFVTILLNQNGLAMRFLSGAAGFLTIFALVATMVGASMLAKGPSSQPEKNTKPERASDEDQETLTQIEHVLRDTELYRDSALTLSRLARRMGKPTREISGAINRGTGENFSRYINALRMEFAKQMLQETDVPVTDIMLEAGFVSKSSFNSEFRRIVGQTPTQFRTQVKQSSKVD